MSHERHRWRRSAFKCTLSVIGLVLFTAQLSYKFYLFASLPSIHRDAGDAPRSARITALPATSSYHSDVRLLLDKRYDYKHTYALIPPLFQLQYFPDKRITLFHPPATDAISIAHFISLFRGPPAISID